VITDLLPAPVRPYAKAIAALVLSLAGWAVAAGFFDVDTGAAITGLVTILATAFGVERIANKPSEPAPAPSPPTPEKPGRGRGKTRSP
jgi:hypothetical protein